MSEQAGWLSRALDDASSSHANLEAVRQGRDLLGALSAERERADAAEMLLSEMRRFLDQDVMPRYVELLGQCGGLGTDSVLVAQARAILARPTPERGAEILSRLTRCELAIHEWVDSERERVTILSTPGPDGAFVLETLQRQYAAVCARQQAATAELRALVGPAGEGER